VPDYDEPEPRRAILGSAETGSAETGPEGGTGPEGATDGGATDEVWRRLRDGFLRPSRSQFILAVVLGLVALGVVMQVGAQRSGEAYESARRVDLIQLVDGLAQETRRLEREVSDLESTKRELEFGTDAQRVAREEAQRRLDALSVLAGTVPTEGPGIRITITDPQFKIGAGMLIDALGEMRDAGAEVIEFNDTVRVTASTWIGGTPGALQVDGTTLPGVIVIEVIGDPHALVVAASFRGGLVSQVTAAKVGGAINVERREVIRVQSNAQPDDHEFARPAR
jgi:uncharacterized protein YlxW (UPF0749 family)